MNGSTRQSPNFLVHSVMTNVEDITRMRIVANSSFDFSLYYLTFFLANHGQRHIRICTVLCMQHTMRNGIECLLANTKYMCPTELISPAWFSSAQIGIADILCKQPCTILNIIPSYCVLCRVCAANPPCAWNSHKCVQRTLTTMIMMMPRRRWCTEQPAIDFAIIFVNTPICFRYADFVPFGNS